jgi:hypothetical protein
MKFQIIFTTLLVLLVVYVSINRNIVTWLKLVSFIVFVLAALAVWSPEWTMLMAHTLGIGRGVDLFIYLSFFVLSFIILGIQAKIRRLEKAITELARNHAIDSARHTAP